MAASKEGDTILDPFMGSGTVLWVAKTLSRKAIGYDISREYCDLAIERNKQMAMELV
jgi:DNA modification methylase